MWKRVITAFVLATVMSVLPVIPDWNGAQGEDTDSAALKETGRTQYRVELSITRPESMEDFLHVTGRQSITFRNDSQDTWSEIVLREYSPAILRDAISTQKVAGRSRPYREGDPLHTAIASVSCAGDALAFQEGTDPTVVRVTLDAPMAPGEIRTIDLTFDVKVTYGSARQGFEQVDHRLRDDPLDTKEIIVSLGPLLPTLPVYADGHWSDSAYSAEAECFYTSCSDYSVSLSVPEGFTAVSSGNETRNDDGTYTIHGQNMRDFALIAGDTLSGQEGKYEYASTVYDGGAVFLRDLRDAMGREPFDAFMRDWYTERIHSIVTTKQFLETLFGVDDDDAVRDVVKRYFRQVTIQSAIEALQQFTHAIEAGSHG